jgi:hypothetical protein
MPRGQGLLKELRIIDVKNLTGPFLMVLTAISNSDNIGQNF